jgi:molybdopterin converting factor small subunit
MSICVRLPALFADRIDGVSRVDVSARTVQDALRAVATLRPELRALVLEPTGEINPMMVIFLNDEQLSKKRLTSSVADGDTIEIIPAIEGG